MAQGSDGLLQPHDPAGLPPARQRVPALRQVGVTQILESKLLRKHCSGFHCECLSVGDWIRWCGIGIRFRIIDIIF